MTAEEATEASKKMFEKIRSVVEKCFNEYARQCFQSRSTPDPKAVKGFTPSSVKDARIQIYRREVDGVASEWAVVDTDSHKFVINATQLDYYQIFNKTTGFNVRMGKTFEDDPSWCPLGPEILDLEISINGCPRVGGASCKFCCPPDTKITLIDGSTKFIQDIVSGDKVLSLSIGKSNRFVGNEVIETYEREYDGDLIVFELDDGKILKVTPNHPFVLRDGTEVKAEDVTPDMDIVVENDYTHCQICGKPKVCDGNSRSFISRHICSRECELKNHNSCLICGGQTESARKVFCRNCVPRSTKYGSRHPLHGTWMTMMERCYNPNRNKHEFYADKGITVCPRWWNFDNFVDDMGERPEGYTLDRLDNDKGYSPDNCKWSPQRDQKLNRGRFRTAKRRFKGVEPHGDKYVANITIGGRPKYLGTFNTELEAAKAYDTALLNNGGDLEHCNIKEA